MGEGAVDPVIDPFERKAHASLGYELVKRDQAWDDCGNGNDLDYADKVLSRISQDEAQGK